MSDTLAANFNLIKNHVKNIDDKSEFKFDHANRQMMIKSTSLNADVELQLKNITASLGVTYDNNSTTGKLKFTIKL